MHSSDDSMQIALAGDLTRADVRALAAAVGAHVTQGAAGAITIDATGLRPDLAALDVLTRVALAARRAGAALTLTGTSAELIDLIALTGLHPVLTPDPSSANGNPMRGKIRSVARKNVNSDARPPRNSTT